MKFRTLFTLIAAFFLTPSLFAQNIEWERSLGGSDYESASYIQQTDDGGYIVAGGSSSTDGDVSGNHDTTDLWVVKLNSSGDTAWTRSLGGTNVERANSIQQTNDGGYIVAGGSNSTDGDVSGNHDTTDFWVVKLNSSGDTSWTRSLGGSDFDYAASIRQTNGGGYIVVGESSSTDGDVSGNHDSTDLWVVKLNSSGDTNWTRSLGGTRNEGANSIRQTSDGGFIVAGYSQSNDGDVSGNHGGYDAWVVKLNSSGDTVWTHSLGGANYDVASSIQQTSDGAYILAGYSGSTDGDVSGNHGFWDYWVVKLNTSGDTLWTRSLGGSKLDISSSVHQTNDGGYIVSGSSRSNDGDVAGHHGSSDYWIVKLNSSGDTIWTRSLGGSGWDDGSSIRQTNDGGYIVAGNSSSINGDVSGLHGAYDYWVVKLGSQGDGGTSIRGKKHSSSLAIRPNPTSGQLRINLGKETQETQLTIRDLTGRTVKREQLQDAQSFRTSIEGEPGLYFVELETADGRREVRKVVKE